MANVINGWEILEEWKENIPSKKVNAIKKYSRRNFVKAKCPNCKKEIVKDKGTVYKAKYCWDCHIKSRSPYGDVTISYYKGIKHCAKERGINFNITLEYISKIFNNQNGLCAYSGRPLKFILHINKQRYLQTASLDRIDSSKGYIEGNVQWIHKDINVMKMDRGNEEFIALCKEISDYQTNFKKVLG